MKLKRTTSIVLSSIKEQAQAEKAYIGNFWADLSSTFFFVATYIVFLDLLFKRAGAIAGYSKNDYFFMMLVGQLTFYTVAHFLVGPMMLIIESVRSGYLDHILLKPVATRIYLYARAIRPLSISFVSLPNIILFCLLIHWSELQLSLASVIGGIVIWIRGLIIFNTFAFALSWPVFTQGDSSNMLNTFYSTMAMTQMPFNKLPGVLRVLSFAVLPAVLMTAGSVAVILHKGNVLWIVAPAIAAAFVAVLLFNWLWKQALTNYTSASS
jgi:ABC-type uncharacterized transport system permease subunit